ncbi:hypothetical protein D3C71_1691370 [compost metagenome]
MVTLANREHRIPGRDRWRVRFEIDRPLGHIGRRAVEWVTVVEHHVNVRVVVWIEGYAPSTTRVVKYVDRELVVRVAFVPHGHKVPQVGRSKRVATLR